MIEDMQLRNLAPQTQRSYLHHITGLARFYQTSPEHLNLEDLRQYQVYLANECRYSADSVNQFLSAAKFLYGVTLEAPFDTGCLLRARIPKNAPIILSQQEVALFFDHVPSIRYRAALMVAYGAGLRVSEVVALKVADIDSQRMLLRVEKGKGQRDRYAMLSPRLLQVLRAWYRAARPVEWLFPGWRVPAHLTPASLQQACHDAARQAGLRKRITVHTLRHASAYYTTFPTLFILKTIGLGQARSGAVYGPRGPLSPVAVRPAMPSPSGRLSTEHTLPHASPVEYVLG
jgi:site-specific recombinase XerD